jgi:phage shock protein A
MAINWTQVNVPTILAVVGAAWGVFQYIGDFDKRLSASEQQAKIEADSNRSKLVDITRLIGDVQSELRSTRQFVENVPYRVGQLEAGLTEQGRRTDRISEALATSLDALRKDVSALGVKIEVLSSKLETNPSGRKINLVLPTSGVPLVN